MNSQLGNDLAVLVPLTTVAGGILGLTVALAGGLGVGTPIGVTTLLGSLVGVIAALARSWRPNLAEATLAGICVLIFLFIAALVTFALWSSDSSNRIRPVVAQSSENSVGLSVHSSSTD